MKIAPTLASLALAVSGLGFATFALAAPEPLDDDALSNSYAGDGTEHTHLPNSPFLNFANYLMTMGSKSVKALSREEFLATMAASGVTALPDAVYDGRPVTEVSLPSHPMTSTFKVSQLLSSMTGVKYDAPGMGTITIQNLDAGGTRLWMWGH